MTAVYPHINVYQKKVNVNNSRNGKANKICIIGAFDTLITDPKLYIDKETSITELGDDVTYNGCKALPQLWKGASSILAVNYTTETGSVRDKTLTTEKLTNCLAKVKGEDFDILYVAESLTDDAIVIIDTFLSETFKMKCPAGFIGGINRANNAAYITTASKLGDHSYGVIMQNLTVNGTSLDLIESSAYYASVIADLNVGNSMTMKQVPNVTGITPELSFETGGDGLALMGAGLTVFKALDRNTSNFVVVNSEQPNGLDLYINRVRDYVVKEMSLQQFLGSRNRPATHNEIIQELDRVKYTCIDLLDLLEDINYTIEKKDAQTVDVIIDSLTFAGIITEINVYITIEVE